MSSSALGNVSILSRAGDLEVNQKDGVVFNPGGPVFSLDWCPMTEAESESE